MAEIVDDVFCPIMRKTIEIGYCVEIQWIADGMVIPTDDEKHLTDNDFQICQNCKKRIDPAL